MLHLAPRPICFCSNTRGRVMFVSLEMLLNGHAFLPDRAEKFDLSISRSDMDGRLRRLLTSTTESDLKSQQPLVHRHQKVIDGFFFWPEVAQKVTWVAWKSDALVRDQLVYGGMPLARVFLSQRHRRFKFSSPAARQNVFPPEGRTKDNRLQPLAVATRSLISSSLWQPNSRS